MYEYTDKGDHSDLEVFVFFLDGVFSLNSVFGEQSLVKGSLHWRGDSLSRQ